MLEIINNIPWCPVYEESPEAVAIAEKVASEAKAAAEATAKAAEEAARAGKTFSQEEINKILAEDRRKHQDQTKKALEELDALKAKSNITAQEREELETRIEGMRSELMTKEELASKEKNKVATQHRTEITDVTKDRDHWKGKFTESTIQRTITDAAVENDAHVPEQIVAILRPNTQLVEALDAEGKPTGDLIPKVKFSDVDKDGKPVTLELTIPEAVKRMREIEKYLNLFKGEGVGGLGSLSRPGGKDLDIKELAKDPKAYREARKKGDVTF